MELVDGILRADHRAIAKAISILENDRPQRLQLVDEVFPKTGDAITLGITGPPGVGKSSIIGLLVKSLLAQGLTTAVISTDPSSSLSSGAFLGDRIRMPELADNGGLFIRSMSSRGQSGGLSGATWEAVNVLDAAGFEIILVETVGVGQVAFDVADIVDLVILVLVPRLGDEIQFLKAGILEVGDIFVVNKKDLGDADILEAEIHQMEASTQSDRFLAHPILQTSALNNEGIDTLNSVISLYFDELKKRGIIDERRKHRVEVQVKRILLEKLFLKLKESLNFEKNYSTYRKDLMEKKQGPYTVAEELLNRISWELKRD